MTATFTTASGTTATRVDRRHPCPVCGAAHGCAVLPDGATLCFRKESDRHTPGGWLHAAPDDGWKERAAAIAAAVASRPRPTRPTADPDATDRAYRALLAAATLSGDHTRNLLDRGMTPERVAAGLYGTLPAGDDDRAPLVSAAAAAAGVPLVGNVPGFEPDRHGRPRLIAAPGLLLPVQDVTGRVVGLRVRVDDPGADSKYRWASSRHDAAAAVDGHACHVAFPTGWSGSARYVVLTEGELKAALTAERLRVPVVSVPGVGNTDRAAETIAAVGRLVDGPAPTVAVAYDADAETNPAVWAHERRIAGELAAAGFRVLRWVWDQRDGKGIDDLLAAGLLPVPTLYEPDDDDPDDGRRSTPAVDPAELATLRRTISLQAQTVANSRALGGDVGGKVALLLAGELAHQAGSNPTDDGFYPVTGARLADAWGGGGRLSPATARAYVGKFAAAGLLEVDERRELVRRGDGQTVPVTRSYVRFDGDVNGLLSRFASGSVYGADEERPQRGGSGPTRKRRLPVECPSCGGETVALCVSCGTMTAAVDDHDGADRSTPAHGGAELLPVDELAAAAGFEPAHRSNLARIGTVPPERSSSAQGGVAAVDHDDDPDRSTPAHGFEPDDDGAPEPVRSSTAHGAAAEPAGWSDRAQAARETLLRRTAGADRSSPAQGEPVPVPLLDAPSTGASGDDRWTA